MIAASLLADILKKGGGNGSKPAVIDAWRGQNGANGMVTTSKTPTFTTFGKDPIPWMFSIFTPDPKFIAKETGVRPQCGIGQKAIFDTNTNQYRCVPTFE